MPLTDSLVNVADSLIGILDAAKKDLGIKDIWYGDQDRIPRSPAVCIETGEKKRRLKGAPRMTSVELPVYLMVYHGALKAGSEGQRKENDRLAEAIETEIHKNANKDLGDTVIHVMCTALEPGFLRKRDAIWQVTRITVEAESQVLLPYT